MTKKVINPTLLWQSIVWVQFTYANLPATEQLERPQRPYQPDDGKQLSPLIGNLRAAYHAAKVECGKKADFDACKKAVMRKGQNKHSWDDNTRNFYSSVIATYITWDYGKISAANLRILKLLTPVMQYAQQKPAGDKTYALYGTTASNSDHNQSLNH
jgi:hypothetical protein